VSIPEQGRDALQHFGIGDQTASFFYQLFEQSLRVALVGDEARRPDTWEHSDRSESRSGTRRRTFAPSRLLYRCSGSSVSHLDLGQDAVDITGRVIASRGRTDDAEFLAHRAPGLAAFCLSGCFSKPLQVGVDRS
jgi:hypothetical protein